jgi:hypothetical protein
LTGQSGRLAFGLDAWSMLAPSREITGLVGRAWPWLKAVHQALPPRKKDLRFRQRQPAPPTRRPRGRVCHKTWSKGTANTGPSSTQRERDRHRQQHRQRAEKAKQHERRMPQRPVNARSMTVTATRSVELERVRTASLGSPRTKPISTKRLPTQIERCSLNALLSTSPGRQTFMNA